MASYLEWGESVWGDVKGGELHVTEKAVEVFREEHRPCQRLVTQALSQHYSTVQSHFCTLISAQVNACQVQVKSFIASCKTNTADVTQTKTANNSSHLKENTSWTCDTLDLPLNLDFWWYFCCAWRKGRRRRSTTQLRGNLLAEESFYTSTSNVRFWCPSWTIKLNGPLCRHDILE